MKDSYKGYCAFAAIDRDGRLTSASFRIDIHPLLHYQNLKRIPNLVAAAYAPTCEFAETKLREQIITK